MKFTCGKSHTFAIIITLNYRKQIVWGPWALCTFEKRTLKPLTVMTSLFLFFLVGPSLLGVEFCRHFVCSHGLSSVFSARFSHRTDGFWCFDDRVWYRVLNLR